MGSNLWGLEACTTTTGCLDSTLTSHPLPQARKIYPFMQMLALPRKGSPVSCQLQLWSSGVHLGTHAGWLHHGTGSGYVELGCRILLRPTILSSTPWTHRCRLIILAVTDSLFPGTLGLVSPSLNGCVELGRFLLLS